MWPPDPTENQYYLLVNTFEASYESSGTIEIDISPKESPLLFVICPESAYPFCFQLDSAGTLCTVLKISNQRASKVPPFHRYHFLGV